MERPMPGVKAIIERNGRLLALKTEVGDSVFWVPPGGRIEYGEKPVEALEREIEEEISCDPDIGDPVGMYHFLMGEESEGNQIVLTVFEADIGDQEVDVENNPADENITDYSWLEPKEFMQRTDNESLRQLIRDYSFDTPKLIRDRIPEIARQNGDRLETETIDGEEVLDYLRQKLVEEAEEFRASGDVEELADVLEIIDAYTDREDAGMEEIDRLKQEKKVERGGFEEGIVLKDMGKETK